MFGRAIRVSSESIDVFYGGGSSSGWGMIYMVAAIYRIVGRNMLATQYVNCVLGAATAPLAYMIAVEIFPNKTVARVSAQYLRHSFRR